MKWLDTPAWVPIDIPASKLPRSEQKLRQALKELAVEKSPRYKAREGQTWCNIFVSDITRALGCEIPHWVAPDGSPADPGKGKEQNANRMFDWLKGEPGASRGWVEADRQTAMDAAARGHTVVVAWHSGSVKPGHIALLLPEGTIAQAGRRNFVGESISQGFGSLPVTFFVQARGPHSELTPAAKSANVGQKPAKGR